MNLQNISHYGDILAIPFFLALSIYFHKIENKTFFEYILYIFSISGFLLDSYFTYLFYSSNKANKLIIIIIFIILILVGLYSINEWYKENKIVKIFKICKKYFIKKLNKNDSHFYLEIKYLLLK